MDASGDSPIVLVQADPESYLQPDVGLRLVSALTDHPAFALVLPVSNEPWTEEARMAPPFLYSTPTLFAEAVASIAARAESLRTASSPASPIYAARREALSGLPPDSLLERVPETAHARGLSAAIDPGSYVHRYGAMAGSARQDLASKVPQGALAVLDVGCSRGTAAAALRSRGVTRIVGIEPDARDADEASRVYDRVLTARLEEIREDWSRQFDAVLFGDVLERLEDPSDALLRVRPWLKAGGVAIASVGNVGHWSIIDDLIRGRFDYVPYSILSGTHVRLFTRRTLVDLFEACGYRIEEIATLALPASPEGRIRLDRMSSFPGASEDLEIAQLLAVARPEI